MMLTENYAYELSEKDGYVYVSLSEKYGEQRTVQFKLIKFQKDNAGIIRHMESLTDANCEQWFPKAKKQK